MKTRFAPSPTGYLHLGNVRTALFNYLLARRHQGLFLLRIEDTDQARSSTVWTEQLQTDLAWLGLQWQQGPDREDEYGPYRQSQRQAIYENYYQRLQQLELAYPCFCSNQELAIQRRRQLASGQPPRYNGACSQLTREQLAHRQAVVQKPSLRFRVTTQQAIEFKDLVKGNQRFASRDIGDFIIRRADSTAAFLFSNAIDDALMGLTHVLRGEDHLSNTARQILLLQALGLKVPHYGHIALILAPNANPLSKREGSCSLKELRESGYLSAALQNYLARLGHYYSNNDFMDMSQLALGFSLDNLAKASAYYDPSQLLYWQKQALQQLDSQSIWQWIGPKTRTLIPPALKAEFICLVQSNVILVEEALTWAQTLFIDPIVLSPAAKTQLAAVDPAFQPIAVEAVQRYGVQIKALTQALQTGLGLKGQALFQPLRLALTGRFDGPELSKIISLLGPHRLQERLQAHLP